MTERRVIAITGASAGIGAALALRAARAGYAVVAVGRNGEALRLLEDRVRHETGSIATLIGDVRDSGTSKAIAQLALERFGRLDVLVANAGVAGRGPLALQTDDELLEQLETHIVAPITLVRACLPLLIASRGTVFVLGSGVGRIPIAGMGLYPASKAGLRSAARTLRNELKPMKIGLTYVDPGAVDTEFMHRRSMPGAPKLLLTSPFVVAGKILRAVDRRPSELNVVPWQTALLAALEHFPKAVDFALRHAGSVTGAPVMKLDRSGATAFERLRDVALHADIAPGASAANLGGLMVPADFGRPVGGANAGGTHADKPAGGLAFIPGAADESELASTPSFETTTPDSQTAKLQAPSDTLNSGDPALETSSPAAFLRTASSPTSRTPIDTASSNETSRNSRNDRTRGTQAQSGETASPFDAIVSDFHAKASSTPAGEPESASGNSADADVAGAQSVPTVPSRSASQRSPKIAADDDALSIVLTPYMQRMRRQNLSLEMLRARVASGAEFNEDEFALDWVGMPNKNERKLIADVCRACADGGLLTELGEKRWQGKGVDLVGDLA